MERARSYRRDRLDEGQLALARERSRHVIVVMLENRSFDHMLGFLDHAPDPKWEPLVDGAHPNPFDLANPADSIGFDTGAEEVLRFDPPHGHASAVMQLNEKPGGGFAMNGFVAAYTEKIAGREKVTTPRWVRIMVLVVVLLAPIVAAAAHNLARLGVNGGWGAFWWPVGAATILAVAVCTWMLGVHLIPCVRASSVAVGVLLVAVVLANALQAVGRWTDERRGAVSWTTTSTVLGGLLVVVVRRRFHKVTSPPVARLRDAGGRIMKCWSPEGIPALATLAREHVVCTRWHSSVPGPTWPNRNFAHAATSSESVDIEIGFYDAPTIFERMADASPADSGVPPWRIYFHDTPQVAAFQRLWQEAPDGAWRGAERLLDDIAAGDLPRYAFVEPGHSGPASNSQHPGNNMDVTRTDFAGGERLIAAIYNALVDNEELFRHTVFVVTYDEHGGFPDRVEPPRALHPDSPLSKGRRKELSRRIVGYFLNYGSTPFKFTNLGVRVPTVIASPWVEPHFVDDTVYDHTSIVASLRRLADPELPHLTRRDDQANDFLHLLVTRNEPTIPSPIPGFEGTTISVPIVADRAATTDTAPSVKARTGDDLVDQLDSLNFDLRPIVTTAPALERTVGAPADDAALAAAQPPTQPVATAVLLRAFGDSTYNGNPTVEDM